MLSCQHCCLVSHMAPNIIKGINYDIDVANGEFDPRCNDGTTDGPWMRVVPSNYCELKMSRAELEALKRIKSEAALMKIEKMAEIESDEMLKYIYETKQEQLQYARRLMRDTSRLKKLGLTTSSFRGILSYVKSNWDNSRMPTILSKTGKTLDDEGNSKSMTFRQALHSTRSRRQAREEAQIERNAEEGNTKLKEYPPEFIKEMIKSRNAQSLTQAQLAQKISRKEAEIAEVERGEAIYDRPLMCLISWALNLGK